MCISIHFLYDFLHSIRISWELVRALENSTQRFPRTGTGARKQQHNDFPRIGPEACPRPPQGIVGQNSVALVGLQRIRDGHVPAQSLCAGDARLLHLPHRRYQRLDRHDCPRRGHANCTLYSNDCTIVQSCNR